MGTDVARMASGQSFWPGNHTQQNLSYWNERSRRGSWHALHYCPTRPERVLCGLSVRLPRKYVSSVGFRFLWASALATLRLYNRVFCILHACVAVQPGGAHVFGFFI